MSANLRVSHKFRVLDYIYYQFPHLFRVVAAFLFLKILVDRFTIQEFGVYTNLLNLNNLSHLLVAFYIPSSFSRLLFDCQDKSQISRLFFNSIVFILVTTLILGGSAAMLGYRYLSSIDSSQSVQFFHFLTMGISSGCFAVNSLLVDYWIYKRNHLRSNLFLVASSIAFYLFFLFFLHQKGSHTTDFVYAVFYSQMVMLVLTSIIIVSDRLVSLQLDRQILKNLATISSPGFLSVLVGHLLGYSDQYLISTYLGPAANAPYSIAYKVAGVIQLIYLPISKVTGIDLCHYLAKENSQTDTTAKKNISAGLNFAMLLMGLAFVFILFVSEWVIASFLKPNYVSDPKVIAFLSLAFIFLGIRKYTDIYLWYQKRNTTLLIYGGLLPLVVNVALNIVLLRSYGIIAAAFSTLVAASLTLIVSIFLVRREFSLIYSFRSFALFLMFVLSAFAMRIWL